MTDFNRNWSLSTEQGVSLDAEELVATLASQHNRMLATWESLSTEQWNDRSRNVDWTVHETARHVADVIEVMASEANDEPWPFEEVPFDPNSTPDLWLAQSASDSSARTIERYANAAGRYRDGIHERFAAGYTGTALTPYGPAHWTMAAVHGFWDAWIHERDIGVPLGIDPTSTAEERRLAALYGLLLAVIPARMMEMPFEVEVRFTGPVEVAATAAHEDGAVSSAERTGTGGELMGDLCMAVDALSGRGSPVADVLPGAPDLLGTVAEMLRS
jgi:hypothetical protein